MAVCCSNAIVSRVDPCCAEQWAMWRNPSTLSLKLMDWIWRDVTSWAVETVNGKTWKVVVTKEDIIWTPTISSSYLTWAWWTVPSSEVTEWSNSLITSGAVYNHVHTLDQNIDNLQIAIEAISGKSLTKDYIVDVINSASTDSKIPTAKAVYDYIESKKIVWTLPITVDVWNTWDRVVSVKNASRLPWAQWLWVCRLSTLDDYYASDSNSVLTPDVIKPIIDKLKQELETVKNKIVEFEQKFEEQSRINESLQKQIDELKEALDNKDNA